MQNTIDENKLLEDLKTYRDQKGYDGLFGLIAKLAPEKIDKQDLENYKNLTPSMTSDVMPISKTYLEQFNTPIKNNEEFSTASIYAEEHIPAVQEDAALEQGLVQNEEKPVEEQHKIRVLERQTVEANPWADAKIVSPGDFLQNK